MQRGGGYGFREPPPPGTAYQTLAPPAGAVAAAATTASATAAAAAAELERKKSTLSQLEDTRAASLRERQRRERELVDTQRAARKIESSVRAASHRGRLRNDLLGARWESHDAAADRSLARRSAARATAVFDRNQRQQEALLLEALALEERAAAAHERASMLAVGLIAQRQRNAGLLQDLGELSQPLGANSFLRRHLVLQQDLQTGEPDAPQSAKQARPALTRRVFAELLTEVRKARQGKARTRSAETGRASWGYGR